MPDKSHWDVKLPDAEKDYKLLSDQILAHKPIKTNIDNAVVNLNILKTEAPLALFHICNNRALHHYRNIYLSDSSALINQMVKNGITHIPFTSLFDYSMVMQETNDQIHQLKQRKNNLQEEFWTIKNKVKKLNHEKEESSKQIQELANEEIEKQNRLKKIEDDIQSRSDDLKSINDDINTSISNFNNLNEENDSNIKIRKTKDGKEQHDIGSTVELNPENKKKTY